MPLTYIFYGVLILDSTFHIVYVELVIANRRVIITQKS